ncbi:MAG: histidine kinase [Pseudonocardia sp.]
MDLGAERWRRRIRLERQLHDGASLRISALSLRLGLLRPDDDRFERAVGELQDELHAVLDELRAVANEIYPSLLDEAGLGAALRELVDQAGMRATVRAGDERFGAAVEGAAYFTVRDCLLAAADSTVDPDPVDVTIRREGGDLVLSLRGLTACHAEHVHDHARPLGGSVLVSHDGSGTDTGSVNGGPTDSAPTNSGPDGGRTITVRIPCE